MLAQQWRPNVALYHDLSWIDQGALEIALVHGSAPPLAGKNVANPMGAILSAALMLDTVGWHEEATRIEAAVEAAVQARIGTADIGGSLGTREVGDWIAARVRNL